MNKEYRKQKIQKRMSRIMVANAVAEADIEAKKAELNGLDELASLQAELATKKAKLAKA